MAVVIDPKRCKSCEFCVMSCPKKILAIGDATNGMGYHVAEMTDESLCISCAICSTICPEAAIELRE